MTLAEATRIAERHIADPDSIRHIDYCAACRQPWPCDAHRAATAYLASVAALGAVMAQDHPALLPGSVDHGNRVYPCKCAVHEDARAALGDVAGEVTP